MVARALCLDPWGGPYEVQHALVFHHDDPFFARFRERMKADPGGCGRGTKPDRATGEQRPGVALRHPCSWPGARRTLGGKSRAEMSLAELKAALAWLGAPDQRSPGFAGRRSPLRLGHPTTLLPQRIINRSAVRFWGRSAQG
jgi:hypothetical protein